MLIFHSLLPIIDIDFMYSYPIMLGCDLYLIKLIRDLDLKNNLINLGFGDEMDDNYKEIENYIQKYKVGGLIFFQGTAEKQAELTNRYQALSKNKLWIGFDGEWGLAMRLKNTINYPRQIMLGAIENEQTIYNIITSKTTVHVDEIYLQSGLSSSTVAACILNLELQNIITGLPGKIYKIN